MSVRIAWVCFAAVWLASCATQRDAGDPVTAAALDRILASDHRSAENRARDPYRHPKETLQFFGIRPDMTVLEVWPGAGWYTEILAPLLRDSGQLYAAQLDPEGGVYAKNVVAAYRKKLAARPDLYDKVIVTTLAAQKNEPIAPAESVDLIVTFRNMHNWMTFGWEREALAAMHAALKPGGILGIVEHRGDPTVPQDPKAVSGYVNEDHAIQLIRSVGFELVGRSQINANPKDEKNYEKGVWTLPPTFAAGDDDRERYAKIGESDRFTLKFQKVTR